MDLLVSAALFWPLVGQCLLVVLTMHEFYGNISVLRRGNSLKSAVRLQQRLMVEFDYLLSCLVEIYHWRFWNLQTFLAGLPFLPKDEHI